MSERDDKFTSRSLLFVFRLDERDIDLETRKTAERMLQKSKEREKARSSRIHSAVSRANAITSARDNWNTLKGARKRLKDVAAATSNSGKITTVLYHTRSQRR